MANKSEMMQLRTARKKLQDTQNEIEHTLKKFTEETGIVLRITKASERELGDAYRVTLEVESL